MDENRLDKEIDAAWDLASDSMSAYTLPWATKSFKRDTANLVKKWVKQSARDMARDLAKKKAIQKIWKLWAKMWAKHLAWLAPAATWIWAVAVPLLEWGMVISDAYDLYDSITDKDFREWVKYLAEDTVNWVGNTVKWVGNFVKNNPKEAAAAAIAPLPYAAYKFVKNRLNKSKAQPIAQLADGRIKYSDWSIR